MRKIIISLLLLCMHFSTQGQTPYEYRYWFDGDISTAVTDSTTSSAWRMEVDLSSLTESFHTIHLQVTDGKGVSSSPATRCFFLSREGGALTNGYYWFDNEVKVRNVRGDAEGSLTFDVTELEEGFHSLHYQVLREDGLYSQIETRCFYKMQSDQLVGQLTFMCYIDGETFKQERVSVENGAAVWFLDVSELPIGFHKLQVRAIMQNGASTTNREAFFLRQAMPSELNAMTCVCSIDGKVFRQEKMQTSNGTGLWQIDVSELPIGFHRLQLRAVMENGASTSIREAFFLRNAMDAEVEALSCVFSIDGKPYKTIESGVHEGVFHCDLDVAALSDGLHKIAYMLTNGKGAQTTVKSQYFIKQPVGGNSIKKYQYWINDNDDMAHTVVQQEVTDPLKLITLLPVEPQPIRSKLFHFETKSGKPMMYAKNEIHLRFFDAAGRFTDASDQYIDYAFGQEVKPVGTLQPTQTFNKVASNDVRWYTMQVAPGDTAAFKLSQPATVQMFAPSGKEVFKTSESASVKWSGIHTWENGTYYLAVHDVTGSKEDMTLEYMHMDKYDVVDWDVHRVGNGGCSTITFKGNGFRDLYAVDLVIAPGDTIHSVDVSHDSDAETAVTFDFTAATLGDYNAVFHFTEEDKPVAGVVTIEEAVDIELATDVSFPSSFSRSATYTVKITNKGNMTAYAVPVYTWLKSKTLNGIYHIDYDGLDLAGIFDGVVTDSLTESEIVELRARSEALGDDHHFLKFWAEEEDHPGDSVFVRSNYFFTNIAPNETKVLRLTISTREVDIYAYFTVPEDWPSYQVDQFKGAAEAKAKFRAPSMKDKYCCIRNKVECVATLVADGASIANTILQYAPDVSTQVIAAAADCVASAASKIISTAGTVMCDDDSVEKNFWDKVNAALDGTSTVGTLSSCLSQLLPWKKVKAILDGIGNVAGGTSMAFGLGVDMANCAIAFTSKVPGCPPPPPNGGNSNGGKSHDPNDIYGYLSEAGSKFIADSVARVNYTIEFENDTTFATAAAHTIVIKDTLDNKVFDLTRFMPTGIRIGSREAFLDEADVVTKNNVTSFVKTIDMRPEINAIAQVDGTFNQKNGIAQWMLQSLDPMTMEPTDDLMQGILPVNYNGTSGIGEVMFEVGVKQGKADGTQIKNRAGIVFDYEEAILTPTWTNIVDAVPPTSRIDNSWMVNDSTLRVTADAFDARSGVWKYTWYVQANENAPWWKEGETESPQFDYHIFEGIDYGFCVLATDSAGNVEQKVIQRERSFKTYGEEFDEAVGLSPLPASPDGEEKAIYDLSGRRQAVPKENQVNIIDKKKVLIR